jgi:hypothetical protein
VQWSSRSPPAPRPARQKSRIDASPLTLWRALARRRENENGGVPGRRNAAARDAGSGRRRDPSHRVGPREGSGFRSGTPGRREGVPPPCNARPREEEAARVLVQASGPMPDARFWCGDPREEDGAAAGPIGPGRRWGLWTPCRSPRASEESAAAPGRRRSAAAFATNAPGRR